MAITYTTPGVYVDHNSVFPPTVKEVVSTIPAFVGYTEIAAKDDNNGKAKGCVNANDNAKVKEKNPHCVDEEPCTDPVLWFQDLDGDGYGTMASITSSCTQPDGFADNSNDCNDTDPDVFPGQGRALR